MTFNEPTPRKTSTFHHTYLVMKSASHRLRQHRRPSSRRRLRCEQLEDRVAVGDVLQIFGGPLFGSNLLFGLWSSAMPGFDEAVAWEAHIGGFLAGLLLFGAFDPVPRLKDAKAPDLQ